MDQRNKATTKSDILDEIIERSWLTDHAPELGCLSDETVLAIIRFTFLWMIFEGKALKNKTEPTNAQKIMAASNLLASSKSINADIFNGALEYFQERYVDVDSNDTNNNFSVLFSRDTPRQDQRSNRGNESPCNRVKTVLLGNNASRHKIVSAVLIIVYRYRNRLFHGPKWLGDDLPNQLQNFNRANDLLKHAIKLNKEQLDKTT